MHLLDLPNEILILILKCLPLTDLSKDVCKVCKKLYQMSRVSALWRDVQLSLVPTQTPVIAMLRETCVHVESIRLSSESQLNTILLAPLFKFPRLKCIDIRECDIYTDRVFSSLDATFTNISCVKFRFYTNRSCRRESLLSAECHRDHQASIFLENICSSAEASDQDLDSMNINKDNEGYSDNRCSNINVPSEGCFEHLRIAKSHFNTMVQTKPHETLDKVVAYMINVASNGCYFSQIKLENCTDITADTLDRIGAVASISLSYTSFNDQNIKRLASNCPSLQNLEVSGCPFITDVGITFLSEYCKHLKSVDLSKPCDEKDGGNVSDHGLEILVKGCELLQELNVSNCLGVGDSGVTAVAEHSPKLRIIKMAGCLSIRDKSIVLLADRCHRLEIVDLSSCLQISSTAVEALLMKCRILYSLSVENCHRLSFVDSKLDERKTYHSSDDKRCADSKEADVKHVKLVSMSQNKDHHDYQEINTITQLFSHVRVLEFAFCTKFTDESLFYVSSVCQDLTSINLRGCHRLTDVSIRRLVKNCKLLKYIDISGGSTLQATKITDDSLKSIALYGRNMTNIVISKNHVITSLGVADVLECCERLKTMDVVCSESSGISLGALNELLLQSDGSFTSRVTKRSNVRIMRTI